MITYIQIANFIMYCTVYSSVQQCTAVYNKCTMNTVFTFLRLNGFLAFFDIIICIKVMNLD